MQSFYAELLEDLVSEAGYASESEAVRAAIQKLHQEECSDGGAWFDGLIEDVARIDANLDHLTDKIDRLADSGQQFGHNEQSSATREDEINSFGTVDAELLDEIYVIVEESEPITFREIRDNENLDYRAHQIRDALQELVEDGYLDRLERDGDVHYKINQT